MPVTVEFFGVLRQRAGTADCRVEAATLGEALVAVAARFPALAESAIEGRRLNRGYVANVNGRRFATDPGTPLAEGDSVLLFAADAGG